MKHIVIVLLLITSVACAQPVQINGLSIPGDAVQVSRGSAAVPRPDDWVPDHTIVPQTELLDWFDEFMPYAPTELGLNTYTRGPAHGEGDGAFVGAVVVSSSLVVLVPASSDYVGLYDPIANTYTRGPAHGEADLAFFGGVYHPVLKKVYFIPYNSDNVGSYDPATGLYASGASVVTSTYIGGSITPQNKIFFAGSKSPNAIYDPVANTVATYVYSSSGNDYIGAQLHPNGSLYLFSYFTVDSRLIFNPATGVSSQTVAGSPELNAYGLSLSNSGNIVMAPWNNPSAYQAQYTPSLASYTPGPDPSEGGTPFAGCIKLQNGLHLWVPNSSSYVGLYDPVTNGYTRGPAHGEGTTAFGGGVLVEGGKVILAPRNADYVGIYNSHDSGMPTSQLTNPWMNHGGL